MATKVVNVLKQGGISLLLIIGLLACEGSIDDVGVNIVDNDIFEEGKFTSEVIAYNKNIEKRIGNKLSQYLLGVYKNDDFGQIEASVIGQLTFSLDVDFGTDPVIDTIILNIPYYATRDGNYEDGKPKFVLDSIFGNKEIPFSLKISELETYLNTLDPENPSEELEYFTDDSFDQNGTPFYSGEFIPNEKDTVSYVSRPEIIPDPENDIYNVDTIKRVDSAPTLKIPLDKDYFTNNFLNRPEIFESNSAFVEFFNGLYLEASEYNDPESLLMALNFSGATMTIYYTNTVVVFDEDIRTKQSAAFNFGGVTINKYDRDYTGSNAKAIIDNTNPVFGDEQLAVQGAAGSIALLDLFTNEDLDVLRSKNWLINDANLIFYVDQSSDLSIIPEQLFLYNYDDNEQLPDLLFEGFLVFGGKLEYDDETPVSYKINVTDYVSRILAFEDPKTPSKLALKVINPTDVPAGVTDIEVRNYNWNPKGIILHGNTTSDIDKRVKLEITYTEIRTN